MVRSVLSWSDRVPEKEGVQPQVHDMTFSPDGAQLIVACGNRVLMYDAATGELQQSLKGHKDTLYCVAYSRDGKRFASGGADKTTIIWTAKAEGILKYSHNEAIQCLAYNPVTASLVSATATDFGLWSPEQKAVAKHKVTSRITCVAWTNDGTCLALGHFSGHISLRDKDGGEHLVIERDAPIWSISWNPTRDEAYELLAVACWDQTLSFYDPSGVQVGRDRSLGFDPCCVRHFANGEYLCVGGSDKQVSLWTKEGVHLTSLLSREGWVWGCLPRPGHNQLAVGSSDGSISVHQLMFATVHGLYRERYAYRDVMTDVVVYNMMSEQRLRIRCKDYVRKVAVYNDRLVVQLPRAILIYDLPSEDTPADAWSSRPRDKISLAADCTSLTAVANHFLLATGDRLLLHSLSGLREREWRFESRISVTRPVGGPAGGEGLLVGLENGQVYKVFVNHPFPILMVEHSMGVTGLDLSCKRDKLAVVDTSKTVTAYRLPTSRDDQPTVLFTEPHATAVAWNTEVDDMLCFSGEGLLSIKTGDFPIHQQRMAGVVVGFKGSEIFALNYTTMTKVDVPLAATLYRYIERRQFAAAYRIANLSATTADWRQLASEALLALDTDTARKCYVRLREPKHIDVCALIDKERRGKAAKASSLSSDDAALVGVVLAFQGKYQEAAKAWAKAGKVDRAIEMFSDLRMWDAAKQYSHTASAGTAQELVKRQAQWAEEVNDLSVAADTYLTAGETLKAIHIFGGQGASAKLHALAKTSLSKTDTAELRAVLGYLEKAGEYGMAKDVLIKLGDVPGLLKLHVEHKRWADATALAEQHPEHAGAVYGPYAEWLVRQDEFDKAQTAYGRAGQHEASIRVLQALAHNAVLERRYADAGLQLWRLASATLLRQASLLGDGADLGPARDAFDQARRKADFYFAYSSIYKYTDEPFTALTPEAVFNIARFLLSWLVKSEAPLGISKTYCLFALAKQARSLGADKLARLALEKLASFRVPPAWQEQVDLFALSVRARPFADAAELMPTCFRCQTANPLLNQAGDRCVACGHVFVRSFVSFEILPLVRFTPTYRSTPEEVLALIRREPPARKPKAEAVANPWASDDGPDVQRLALGGDVEKLEQDGMLDLDDPFTKAMLDFEPSADFTPPVATPEMLLGMDRSDVFVIQWPHPALGREYYRNMLPDVPVVLCTACNHFFHEEDWEFAVMQKGACPFCQAAVDASYGNGSVASMVSHEQADKAAAAAAEQ